MRKLNDVGARILELVRARQATSLPATAANVGEGMHAECEQHFVATHDEKTGGPKLTPVKRSPNRHERRAQRAASRRNQVQA
jgi:hypothetical protein